MNKLIAFFSVFGFILPLQFYLLLLLRLYLQETTGKKQTNKQTIN